jgi:hypothetical protein
MKYILPALDIAVIIDIDVNSILYSDSMEFRVEIFCFSFALLESYFLRVSEELEAFSDPEQFIPL